MTATAEVENKTTEQLVAELGRELESSQYELYLQDRQIAELKESVEDLMAGSRIETTHQPEIRVRIGHTHTLKDGWRCDSTTVEWTGRGEVNWGAIRDELKNSHIAGEEEAKARHNEALAPS